MTLLKKLSLWILILSLCYSCAPDSSIDEIEESDDNAEISEFLPLTPIKDSFLNNASDNWVRAATVFSDPNKDQHIEASGTGKLIVNQSKGNNLVLDINHGDLELEVDFMVPKGSNSGIYFQGRYEVQILDSWRKDEITTADVGSIYQDWDKETNTGYNGSVPIVNAAKAPGLWQNFRVVFRAPKFDEDGNKTANAKFEKVYLNGFLIQENVESPKPTRASMSSEEVATGPLMIQGDHGPVAFRNLKYKKMGFDTLALTDLNYKLYTGGVFNSIPNFDTLTPIKTGTANSLDELQDLAEQQVNFAFVFDGKLQVPKTGEYLLSTHYDDGGDVFIDGELVLHNGIKEYENQPSRAIINLTEGAHDIKFTHFQNVWATWIMFQAEGPEIPRHTVGCVQIFEYRRRGRTRKEMLIDPIGEPELIRGYVNYKDEKRTHALSVGDPSGVHYSYDLREGALLKVWRGGFANVTNMWVGRGHSQLLLPQNAAVPLTAGIPIAKLNSASASWPAYRSDSYKNIGYDILPSGHPEFKYQLGSLEIADKLTPSSSGNLSRSIRFESDDSLSDHWYKIASADIITKMDDSTYSIGGNYYLKSNDTENWELRTKGGNNELVTSVNGGTELSYEIIW